MKLFLLRHAKAEKDVPGLADRERRLTAKGKAEAREKARTWRKKLSGVEKIVTSPYPRAAETAGIVAAVLGCAEAPVEDEALAATARAEDVLIRLREYARHEELLLVGHEPWMSALTSLLIGGTTRCRVRLKKTGLAVLDVDELAAGGATLTHLS